MSWVVDTCIVIDVCNRDPLHHETSTALLRRLAHDGLVLCPVSFVELAPTFGGNVQQQCDFLDEAGFEYEDACWIKDDTYCANAAWHRYVAARRASVIRKRPLADILIGAFATRHDGLITRNPSDFAAIFPALPILTP